MKTNLYIYCRRNDLTAAQKKTLKSAFDQVEILSKPDFELLYNDETPKVVALDPDVVGWTFSNEIIDQIPSLKVQGGDDTSAKPFVLGE